MWILKPHHLVLVLFFFFFLCSFVFFSVLCRKTKRDHSITNPCGIDLATTYLNYQRFVHLRVKTCI
ncbi:unnamed protein product [Prunus brigantina]